MLCVSTNVFCSIVFSCGHVICSFCYVRHFKFNNYQRFNSYYTTCPHCSEYFTFSDATIISQEIEEHPNSTPSLFYRNALIPCDNYECNQIVSLSNWCNHIKFKCDHRIVQCPAIHCSINGKPNDILSHSIQCPFHTVWCARCKIKWTVLATSHNCEKSKEYKQLGGNVYHLPRYLKPTEDGAVVLKEYLSSSDKTSDVSALDEVDYLDSTYRYKENMNKVIYPIRSTRPNSPLCLIDENTQLPTFHSSL